MVRKESIVHIGNLLKPLSKKWKKKILYFIIIFYENKNWKDIIMYLNTEWKEVFHLIIIYLCSIHQIRFQ